MAFLAITLHHQIYCIIKKVGGGKMLKEKKLNLIDMYKKMSLPVKVSLWFFFCSLLQKGLSFLTTPIFTRILSTEDYGLVSVFNSWEQIIIIFVAFGLANSVFNVGLVTFSKDKDGFQSSMFGMTSICAVVFSCIFLCLYKVLEPIIQLDFKFILILLIYCFSSSIMALWIIRERFEYHYKKMVIITVANTIIGPILSVIFVFKLCDKAFAKVLGTAVVTSIIAIFCYGAILRRKNPLYNKEYWHFAFKYNLPMIPHFLSSVLLNQLDRIMIKNICGASEAGIYSVAYHGAGVIYIINQALSAAYNPWLLQRLNTKNYKGIKETVNVILLFYVSLLISMILFAPEMLKLLATSDYYEGIYVVPPVACSMFFILLFNLFAPIEHYSLKTKFIGIASVISAVANIILNYVFIQKFGYLAAAYTTLVCYILYAIAHYIYMRKVSIEQRIKLFDEKFILALSVLVITIAITFSIMYRFTAIRYLLIVFIMLLVYIFRKRIIDVIKATIVKTG